MGAEGRSEGACGGAGLALIRGGAGPASIRGGAARRFTKKEQGLALIQVESSGGA